MIVNNKTGCLVIGELAKDPIFKQVGNGNTLMSLNVRYFSEKSESGKWLGKFIDVNCWQADEDLLTGMLKKGDAILACGHKVEKTESNGKTYYKINAFALLNCTTQTLCWLQQAINMMWSADGTAPQEPQEPPTAPTAESWPTTAQPPTAPPPAPSTQPAFTEDEMRIIDSDDEDLPF